VTVHDHAFFGADPADPLFNLGAANRTFQMFVDDPEQAHAIAKRAVWEAFTNDLVMAKDLIQKDLDLWARARIEEVRAPLRRAYATDVVKGGSGVVQEMTNQALDQIEALIAKADTFTEGRWVETRVKRDEDGQFSSVERRGGRRGASSVSGARGGRRQATFRKPIAYGRAGKIGGSMAEQSGLGRAQIVDENGKPDMEQTQKMREAWLQLQDMTRDVGQTGAVGMTRLQVSRVSEKGIGGNKDVYQEDVYPMEGLPDPETLTLLYSEGWSIDGVEVDIDPDLNIAGASFDALTGLGMTGEGAGALVGNSAGAINQLKGAGERPGWNAPSTAATPRGRAYNRLESGAKAAQAVLPANANPTTRMALEVAGYAGKYGQSIENMVGPTTERAAYRFRGTERKANPKLQQTLDGLRQSPSVNGSSSKNDRGARDQFVLGSVNDPQRTPPQGALTLRDYLTSQLPDASRLELHLESGRGTPSKGVLLDEQGRVVSESVGMGEDHYLPFPARALRKMDGGEYARTRTYGGPTTEDFAAAITGGARAFTVVSHSGVFSVEFEPDFRGGRRFNDKTKRMVKQYANILDSLQAEVVGREVPDDRMGELQAQARERFKVNAAERRNEVQRLKAIEMDAPTLSQKARIKVFEETLNRTVGAKETRSGLEEKSAEAYDMRMKQLRSSSDAADAAKVEALESNWALANMPGEEGEKARLAVMSELGGSRGRLQYKRALEDAQYQLQNDTHKLRLDGTGYEQALMAMHEQFPYYMKKPVVILNKDAKKKDDFYTRPGDSRPYKVKIGFHNAPNAADGALARDAQGNRSRGRKASAAELYGREGAISNSDNYDRTDITADKGKGDRDQKPAAPAGTPSPGQGTPRPAAAKKMTPVERQAKITEKMDILTGKLQGMVANQGLVYGPLYGQGTMVPDAAAVSSRMEEIVAEVKTKADLQSPAGVEYLTQLLDKAFEGDAAIEALIDDLRDLGGNSPALSPEAAAAKVKSTARQARARGDGLNDDEKKQARRQRVEYGSEYAEGRTADEYQATYEGLLSQALQEGYELPALEDRDAIEQAREAAYDALVANPEGSAQAKAAEEQYMLMGKVGRLNWMMQNAQNAPEPAEEVPVNPGGLEVNPGGINPGAKAPDDPRELAGLPRSPVQGVDPVPRTAATAVNPSAGVMNRGANDGQTVPMPPEEEPEPQQERKPSWDQGMANNSARNLYAQLRNNDTRQAAAAQVRNMMKNPDLMDGFNGAMLKSMELLARKNGLVLEELVRAVEEDMSKAYRPRLVRFL
jgi:hypothetical protein